MTRDELQMTLYDYVYYRLKQLNLSIRRLATLVGVSNTYISGILLKEYKPTDILIDKLIEHLGADRILFYYKLGRIPPEITEYLLSDIKLINYLYLCKTTGYTPYKDDDEVGGVVDTRPLQGYQPNKSRLDTNNPPHEGSGVPENKTIIEVRLEEETKRDNSEPMQDEVTIADTQEPVIIENPEIQNTNKFVGFQEI